MTVQIDAWEHHLLAQAYEPLENRLRHAIRPATNRDRYQHAYAYCQDITREHSRTFYMASSLLPVHQRKAIQALYAFCRVSDDLVDEGTGDRTTLVESWKHRSSEPHPPEDDLVALA